MKDWKSLLTFGYFLVGDCKVLFKSIRDSLRYRQKKISGKSGDSGGDEMNEEMAGNDNDVDDALSFLASTSSKFPRKTMVLGGATNTASLARSQTPTSSAAADTEQQDSEAESSLSAYSYVSLISIIDITYTNIWENKCTLFFGLFLFFLGIEA